MAHHRTKSNRAWAWVAVAVALVAVILAVPRLWGGGLQLKESVPTTPPATQPSATSAVLASPTPVPTPTPTPQPQTLTIAAAGDVMCHSQQYKDAYNAAEDRYDFTSCFEEVAPYIQQADLALANFETTTAGAERGYSGYPNFNSPDSLVTALKEAGFDVLTTANNHSLDTKFPGVTRTIDVIRDHGLYQTGTYKDAESYDDLLLVDVKGFKVAILAYTYGCNGMEPTLSSEQRAFAVRYLDMGTIRSDIVQARALGAEIVLVCAHWGVEYQTQPSDVIRNQAQEILEAGADVILGSHPHVLQPCKRLTVTREDGTSAECAVIYSLGNFVSGQRTTPRDCAALYTLTFTRDENGAPKLDGLEYLPTYVNDTGLEGKRDIRILPVGAVLDDEQRLSRLTSANRSRIASVWDYVTGLLGEEHAKPVRG